MNSAAYGILARLLDHFWFTDCAPFPAVDHALYQLARAHKPTWFQNRAEIKAVLVDVLPELKAARVRYDQRSSILRGLSQKGALATKAKSLAKAAPASAAPPLKPAGGFIDKDPQR